MDLRSETTPKTAEPLNQDEQLASPDYLEPEGNLEADSETVIQDDRAWWLALLAVASGWIIKIASVIGLLIVGAWLFVVMERNEAVSEALSLSEVKERIEAIPEAVYWEYRAWQNASVPMYPPDKTRFGYARGFEDGKIVVEEFSGRKRVTKRYALATLSIPEARASRVREWVTQRRSHEARFDLYQFEDDLHAVVWSNGEPWNVLLITEGMAFPSTNPPSNIIDQVYAEHFWNIVRGQSSQDSFD